MAEIHEKLTSLRFVLATTLLLASWFVFSSNSSEARELVGTQPSSPSQPFQWRLVWTSDPTSSARVCWSTQASTKKNVLHLSSSSGTSRAIPAGRNGAYSSSDKQSYYHHVTLEDLQPDTRYEVTLESDSVRSPDFWFRTASAEDGPMSLIFGGDSRSDPAERRKVNRLIASLAERNPSIVCFAHGGDYVNTGSSFNQWTQWMSDHELTTGRDGRLLPIVPARGNHDHGVLFEETFGFPSGDNNYFAINVGPQVRLVTLNTEISAGGEQKKWLESELETARKKDRFVVVQYHRPAYPAVKRPSSAKQHWVPLFEKYDVDLVCEADGHNIKRTVPIRGDKQDPTGIVYIGEGGLGVPQRVPKKDRWFLRSPGLADQGHHVHVLTFGSQLLSGKAIGLGGKERDSFQLLVRRSVLRREASTPVVHTKKLSSTKRDKNKAGG